LAASVISGIVGAGVVYLFGIRQFFAQARSNFRKQQLSDFYAPLAGIRQQIIAQSSLRVKIRGALPAAVLVKLRHTEETLVPFYKHVDERVVSIQREILFGKPSASPAAG